MFWRRETEAQKMARRSEAMFEVAVAGWGNRIRRWAETASMSGERRLMPAVIDNPALRECVIESARKKGYRVNVAESGAFTVEW